MVWKRREEDIGVQRGYKNEGGEAGTNQQRAVWSAAQSPGQRTQDSSDGARSDQAVVVCWALRWRLSVIAIIPCTRGGGLLWTTTWAICTKDQNGNQITGHTAPGLSLPLQLTFYYPAEELMNLAALNPQAQISAWGLCLDSQTRTQFALWTSSTLSLAGNQL